MKKTYLLLIATATLFSCQKALDIEPKMIIESGGAVSSVKDLETVLTGAYDGMQSGNIFGGNFVALSDFMAEDTKVDETKLSNFGTREIYFRQTTVQIGLLGGMWGDAYSVINRCNNVLDVIDNNILSGSEFESKKGRIKGEALFIRAVTHFELVRLFALPYDVESANNTQPGIPYRVKPILDGFDRTAIEMARNSVQEVYEKALADLDQAITLLNDAGQTTNIGRASAMAATAYKARIQFMMGRYGDAYTSATAVINSGNYSLNDSLTTVFLQAGNSATDENIFQMVNITTDNSNSLQGFYRRAYNPVFTASDELYDSFDSLDYRKTQLLEKDFADRKFSKKYNQPSAAPINVNILRLSEMYLIAAECNLSPGGNGNVTEALTFYNAIRSKAYKGNQIDETNPNGLLAKIQAERRRELCFEGDRLHNLKRMKQNLRDGVAWNDASVLFKIPQAEMSGNPLMEQNP
jgi:hypothetical protein